MTDLRPESPFWRALNITYKSARRIVIGVVGGTVILIGAAMLVLPGPAFIVIPTGLAILGVEFAFARRWLRFLRRQARSGLHTIGWSDSPVLRRAQRIRNGSARRSASVGRLDLPKRS
jgi:tellurite resistance protein TerC